MSFSLSFVRRALAVCAALTGFVILSGPARAADPKKGVTVEEIEYKGWKHNLRISNGDTELIVTLDVGPRDHQLQADRRQERLCGVRGPARQERRKGLADPRRHAAVGRAGGRDADLFPGQRAGPVL